MPGHRTFLGRVMVVDDDEDICNILEASLNNAGFWVSTARNLTEAKDAIKQRFYDAVLLDVFLGEEDGFDGVPYIVATSPFTKILMMSAHGTIELAVDAMKKGAASFISKTKNAGDIVEKLKFDLVNQNDSEKAELCGKEFGFIGKSPQVQKVLKQIEQVRNVSSNVLIIGESGTGKELVARALHSASERRSHRFAAINCGAIPASLLESELFGHKRGSFTDAKYDRIGIFEACSQGTLLLDEIGEMPLELQVKLLRVLQEREITPLGSSKSVKVNTRVLASTNRNLISEIKAGRFREDLYYRLSVITIENPPLSSRKADIPILVEYFLGKMNAQFNKKIKPPSQELVARLMTYSWPGNIRELQNSIERAVILSDDGELHLENMFQTLEHNSTSTKREGLGAEIFHQTLSDAKKDFEKEYLKQLLEITRGDISKIADISSRYRADIYRLLSKHGLEWDEFRNNETPQEVRRK